MSGVIGAELTKMRKRTGLLVILGVWPLLIFLFGYLANYLFRNAAGMPDEIRAGITDSILPNQFVANAVGGFPLFGFALGLIFGALVVGSEYGWGTVGNLLIQGPTRLQVHLGRLTALVIMSLVMTLCALAIAATSSVVFSGLLDQTSDWPPLAEIARGLGAGWLIMTVAMFLGATAALLLRGTALAIGLGLVYVLVGRVAVRGVLCDLRDRRVHRSLPARCQRRRVVIGGPERQHARGPGTAVR